MIRQWLTFWATLYKSTYIIEINSCFPFPPFTFGNKNSAAKALPCYLSADRSEKFAIRAKKTTLVPVFFRMQNSVRRFSNPCIFLTLEVKWPRTCGTKSANAQSSIRGGHPHLTGCTMPLPAPAFAVQSIAICCIRTESLTARYLVTRWAYLARTWIGV